MIDVQNVTKRYGPTLAVDDVSFSVEKGEIVGFLGPNAAGKTTTMRIITNYMPATEGRVSVAGFDVFEEGMEVKKRIGYLPENPPLYPEMRVNDFLRFVAALKGVEKSQVDRQVDRAVELTTLGEMRERLIKKLSKGFRQRVGLAQALINEPDVLILDEPTVGLDPKQIIEVRELIKSLAADHTIILSTHILPEVSMVCERVVIINRGRIVAEDSVENLMSSVDSGETLVLQVAGPFDAIREQLTALDGVNAVHLDQSVAATGTATPIRVDCEPGTSLRSEIAKTVVSNDWGLLELRPIERTLEDVFLELTTEEQEVQA